MKKIKIFYVYGYGDMPDSPTIKRIENLLNSSKYQIISDYYAQYNPKEALYDIENYIKENNIDIIIGENLGGYLVTLLDNDLPKILIDPIYNPTLELLEYETIDKDDKGNEITVKLVPPHVIKFYNDYDGKPIYNDNIYGMFSTQENFEEYSKVLKNCNIYKDIFNSLSETLNNIGES